MWDTVGTTRKKVALQDEQRRGRRMRKDNKRTNMPATAAVETRRHLFWGTECPTKLQRRCPGSDMLTASDSRKPLLANLETRVQPPSRGREGLGAQKMRPKRYRIVASLAVAVRNQQ